MGGGDKARIAIGGVTILQRVLACSRRNARASSSTPTATRPVLPIPACRSWPIACRISPVRLPAFSPGSIGRRRMRRQCEWIVSVPGDCPFLPSDLVARLHAARIAAATPLACARSGEWRHPVVGLWPVALREDLRRALLDEACARSKSGPRATASRLPIGRPRRSIRSSMSTRPRMPRRRKCSQRNIRSLADQRRVGQKTDRRAGLDVVTSSPSSAKSVGFGERGEHAGAVLRDI